MTHFQLLLQLSTDKNNYQWQLSRDHKPIAAGQADLLPETTISLRDQQVTLADLNHYLLLDFDNNKEWLAQYFDEAGHLTIGNYLFKQTLAKCRDDLPNSGQSVQLVVVSDDAFIQRLPWNVLSADSITFLIHNDWTISVATHSSSRQVKFSKAPRVLLACPDIQSDDFAPTQGQQHAEAIRQELVIDPLFNGSEYLMLTTTWQSFQQQLKQQAWDVIYFYGHGTADDMSGKLWFVDGDGNAEPISMLQLANVLRGKEPVLLYLNACQTANGSIAGAVTQLSANIPALILNRTNAFMYEARDQALSLLTDILLNHASPQLAIKRAYLSPTTGMSSTAWMTPMLFQHYQQWVFPQKSIAPFTSDPNWRLKLDRVPQFSQVHYHVSTMLQQRHPLALACFWHGVKGQGVERFHERLPVELQDLQQTVRLHTASFPWSAHLTDNGDGYASSFEFMLRTGFEIERLELLAEMLERRYLDTSSSLLLLHCRFYTLSQQGLVKLHHVAAFLEWWQHNILPKLAHRSIHVLLAFGYELDEPNKKFTHYRDKELLKTELAEDVQWLLLDELPPIEYDHVMEFLRRYKVKLSNRNGSLNKVVHDIIAETKGDYDRTLDALQRIVSRASAAARQADDDHDISPF